MLAGQVADTVCMLDRTVIDVAAEAWEAQGMLGVAACKHDWVWAGVRVDQAVRS